VTVALSAAGGLRACHGHRPCQRKQLGLAVGQLDDEAILAASPLLLDNLYLMARERVVEGRDFDALRLTAMHRCILLIAVASATSTAA
jgi:hypothetical protein